MCSLLISQHCLLLLLVQNENDSTSLFGWRRVVPVEELFEIISEVQCKGHIRYMTRKTYIFPLGKNSLFIIPCEYKVWSRSCTESPEPCFLYVGVPKILHSGNGHEFVNEVVESVVREYPAEVIIHIVAITYNTSGTIWSGQIELFVASPVPCALVRPTNAADVKVDEQSWPTGYNLLTVSRQSC